MGIGTFTDSPAPRLHIAHVVDSVMILLAGDQHTKVEEVVNEARGHPEFAASGLACSLTIARMFPFYMLYVPVTMTFTKVLATGELCICSGHVARTAFHVLPLCTLGLDSVSTVEQAALLTMAQAQVVSSRRCTRRPPGQGAPVKCKARYHHTVAVTIGRVLLLSSAQSDHTLAMSRCITFPEDRLYELALLVIQRPGSRYLVQCPPHRNDVLGCWSQYDTSTGKLGRLLPGKEGEQSEDDFICLWGYIRTQALPCEPLRVSGSELIRRLQRIMQYDQEDIITADIPVVHMG